jgi:hypothetical protein
MRRRRRPLVAAAVGLATVCMSCGDDAGDVLQDLGLDRHAPPFVAGLGGGLYDARTLHDQDNAPDLAYLTKDLPLRVRAAATSARVGLGRLTVSIDGRPVATRSLRCGSPRAGNDGCPRRASLTLTPPLVTRGAGEHRVAVRASSRDGKTSARLARFAVNVGDAPVTATDVEPRIARAPVGPGLTPVDRSAPDPAVAAIVRAASRTTLAPVLGRSRAVVRETGTGGPVVTALVDVVPARTSVSAVLPQVGGGERARMTAARLADLAVDVDVRRGTVVGIEPGPDSRVTSWSLTTPALGADERLSGAFTPRHAPRLLTLSALGPGFLADDGDPTLRDFARDWPLSMIFTGNATIAKVKAGLRSLGLTRRGHARYLGYRTAAGIIRFDGDRGLKTACDQNATDVHARLYAPTATDTFVDPELGRVVAATVHLDHRDGCGVGPQLFGFSERAERLLARSIAAGLGWRVVGDQYPLGNAEPLRRDAADPTHVWLSDGLATGVVVP